MKELKISELPYKDGKFIFDEPLIVGIQELHPELDHRYELFCVFFEDYEYADTLSELMNDLAETVAMNWFGYAEEADENLDENALKLKNKLKSTMRYELKKEAENARNN